MYDVVVFPFSHPYYYFKFTVHFMHDMSQGENNTETPINSNCNKEITT
jgi:hypothetical protein